MLDNANAVGSDHESDSAAPWRFTLVISGLWTIGYAIRGVLQYIRFHSLAFDLGIFAQGTWLLSQIKEPFVTLRGLHLFTDHSSYILILIAPLYAMFPSAGTLIVLTAIAMGLIAPVAYGIARRAGASSLLSSLTALLALLSPAVQWQIHAAFHPEVFVVPLVLAAVALVQRDRTGWAIAAVAIALTAKEDVGLLVVPLGLAVAFIMGKRRMGLIFVAMGLVAFFLNFFVLLPLWSPTGELLYTGRYAYLGDSPLGILWGLMTSPDVWWDTIVSGKRIGYVASLVLAMPLSVLGWRWLLVGLPVLASNVLSLHHYQYRVQSHYTAYCIVVVVVAAAYGAARFDAFGRFRWRRPILVMTIVIPIVMWILAGPITVWAPPHGDPERIEAMLDLIPDDASVSATTTFTPQLANRDLVYVFPNPWQSVNYGTDGVEPPDPETIEWIAVRMDADREFEELIAELTLSGEYSVAYEDRPFLLLRRTSPQPL